MTDPEINAAVAECCGWELRDCWEPQMCFPGGVQEVLTKRWFSPGSLKTVIPIPQELPDYCTDLNAMHEAEKTLSTGQKRAYMDRFVWSRIHSNPTLAEWGLVHVTARQRAEAFLRTHNKWGEA